MITTLSPDQHQIAEVIAFFTALKRGNGQVPPYHHGLAVNDFLSAVDYVTSYEPDSDDPHRDRLLPTVLRDYSSLDDVELALDEFLALKDSLRDECYWALLGHIWVFSQKKPSQFDHRYSKLYSQCFESPRKCREYLMIPDERIALLQMPEQVSVYRGCQTALNEEGLSWSTSREVAEDFARRYYPEGPRSIIRGTCNPRHAIAYFNYSKEQELVIDPTFVFEKIKVN